MIRLPVYLLADALPKAGPFGAAATFSLWTRIGFGSRRLMIGRMIGQPGSLQKGSRLEMYDRCGIAFRPFHN